MSYGRDAGEMGMTEEEYAVYIGKDKRMGADMSGRERQGTPRKGDLTHPRENEIGPPVFEKDAPSFREVSETHDQLKAWQARSAYLGTLLAILVQDGGCSRGDRLELLTRAQEVLAGGEVDTFVFRPERALKDIGRALANPG